MDERPPVFPASDGTRLLSCSVRELIGGDRYRVRVCQVTLESDTELVGTEVLLSVSAETLIFWIGDDDLDVGTNLLVPVGQEEHVEAGALLSPSEITLQNGAGVTL